MQLSLKKHNFKTEEKHLSLYQVLDLAVFKGRTIEAGWQDTISETVVRELASGHNSSEDHDWSSGQLMSNVKSCLGGRKVNYYNLKKNSLERRSCTALRGSELMVNLFIPLSMDNCLLVSFTHNLYSQCMLDTFWHFMCLLWPFQFLVATWNISIFLIDRNTAFYVLCVNLQF